MSHPRLPTQIQPARKLAFERLEQRALLSIVSAWDYDRVSPEWFATAAALPEARFAAAAETGDVSPDQSRWIVRLTPEATSGMGSVREAANLLLTRGVPFVAARGLGLPGQLLLESSAPAAEMEAALRVDPYVAYFEIDGPIYGQDLPTETELEGLWGLERIVAQGAWATTAGSPDVVVAVLDTGIDYTHPDLYLNVNDPVGWDFVNDDNDPMDDHGHGTHVAGTIAAVGGNSVGIVGVSYTSSLMALKVLDENNQGSFSVAAAALNYLAMLRTEQGVNVRVANASWGSMGEPSDALREAIEACGDAGILFVAAAGNGDSYGRGIDNDAEAENGEEPPYAFYPASYDLDNIISVAATDSSDRLARFSNYGVTSVDIAAPGVGILSTEPGGTYETRYGTSMAAPHVSGVAALIWSEAPDATVAEVREAIHNGSDAIDAFGDRLAWGSRLNAFRALNYDAFAPRVTSVDAPNVTGPGDTDVLITVTYSDNRLIDVGSLDASDIVVTRLWDGHEVENITIVSKPTSDADQATVVYRVPAPGGQWGALVEDDGDYQITLQPNQVSDANGNYVEESVLGTFNVDTTEGLIRVLDTQDSVSGDTLRAAIIEANALAGDNTIRIPPGTYTLTIPGAGEDAAATGDLDITDNLTIRGAGADVTTIDATGLGDRVLDVLESVRLDLFGVTITGGNVTGEGGGIYNAGDLTVADTTISGNRASVFGGGVSNAGTAMIQRAAIWGNQVTEDGGGLDNTGTMQLANVTVSGNSAGRDGGGISNYGDLTLVNVTVSDNSAVGRGGGVLSQATTNVTNTIVAGNGAATGPDVFGSVDSQGYNLIGDTNGGSGWETTDLKDVDPMLGPLQNNGGPTLTHVLSAGSPAIDAGDNAAAPATDQRGIPRPQDADGDGIDTVDVGAVERYYGTIQGVRFLDINGDGVQQESLGEVPLAGKRVYLDLNANGARDPDEPTTTTDATGAYSLTGATPGVNLVAEVLDEGWEETLKHFGLGMELVSRASGGRPADGATYEGSISADGRYVAFASSAETLVPDDTNEKADIFVYDRQMHDVERVSVASDGSQGNEESWYPSISADGRFVAFISIATNLVPGDTNLRFDVFVHDRWLHTTERVSMAWDGSESRDDSYDVSISPDGRFVAFSSADSHLAEDDVDNAMTDVYVYDREARTIRRVTWTWNGELEDGNSRWPSIASSANGDFYLAFESDASNLVPGDTNGVTDVFVYRSQTDTIQRIDRVSGLTTTMAAGNSQRGNMFDIRAVNTVTITGFDAHPHANTNYEIYYKEGTHVGFETDPGAWTLLGSASGVVAQPQGTPTPIPIAVDVTIPAGQAYSFYVTSTTSVNQWYTNGTDVGNVFASDANIEFLEGTGNPYPFGSPLSPRVFNGVIHYKSVGNGPSADPSISADGRYVAFESDASNLADQDQNGKKDVFLYDGQTDQIQRVSFSHDGSLETRDSEDPSISADGSYVAFTSKASNLVTDDRNGSLPDIFLYSRVTDTIDPQPLSLDADGSQLTYGSGASALSADGNHLLFLSSVDPTIEGPGGWDGAYVRDRPAETTERVSVTSHGPQGEIWSRDPFISADGRYVVFDSDASNLVPNDGNAWTDVFVYDRQSNRTERVNELSDVKLMTTMDAGSAQRGNMFDIHAINTVTITSFDAHPTGDTDYEIWYKEGSHVGFEADSAAWTLVGSASGVVAQPQGNPTPIPISVDVTIPAGQTYSFYVTSTTSVNLRYTIGTAVGSLFAFDPNIEVFEGTGNAYPFGNAYSPRVFNGVVHYDAAGNSGSVDPSISADGRFVAFSSSASNLVPAGEDALSYTDIFIYDRETRTFERASVAPDGSSGNDSSASPSISADGRYVAFLSRASNLVPGDLPSSEGGVWDVFVYDRETGDVERASQRTGLQLPTTMAAGNAQRGNMFDINAVNTVTITGFDAHPQDDTDYEIYYRKGTHVGFETDPGAWTLVGSATNVVAQPQGTPTPIPISVDVTIPAGQTYSFYVTSTTSVNQWYTNGTAVGDLFASDANIEILEGTGNPYPFGAPISPRVFNGVIHYTAGGNRSSSPSERPAISADGRYVAFSSEASNLVDGDQAGFADVFLYDRHTRTIERISRAPDGSEADDSSWAASISANGRYVGFTSAASNLAREDKPYSEGGYVDVFVYDRTTQNLGRISETADGSGANGHSERSVISADGWYVVFGSFASNLVPSDTNGQLDVFVRDLRTNTIQAVNVDPHGRTVIDPSWGFSMTADGRYVAFDSHSPDLVPIDANDAWDVFVNATMAVGQARPQMVLVTPGEFVAGPNFGNRPLPGGIRGQKFYDLDADGLKDPGEPGITGWTIYLDTNGNGSPDAGEPSTTTDGAGKYSFTGLAPETSYVVGEVAQPYWVQTFPRLSDGGTWTVEIGPGEVVTDVDFGDYYRGPGGQDLDSISGRVFLDGNDNGQDDGETGLQGQMVRLYTLDGQLVAEQTTDESGGYAFQIGPGEYEVRVVLPSGYRQTTPLENDWQPQEIGQPDFTTSMIQAMVAADLDGDGHVDLAIAYGNKVAWLKNNSSGELAPPVVVYEAGTQRLFSSMAVGDFGGDQKIDLVVTDYNLGEVLVLINQGGGVFAEPSGGTYAPIGVGFAPTAIATGDIDSDAGGNLDLVVANESGDTSALAGPRELFADDNVSLLRHDGSGRYFVEDSRRLPVGKSPSALVMGQFNDDNGDGRIDDADSLDFAAANFGDVDPDTGQFVGSSVSVWLNRGDGTFNFRTDEITGGGPTGLTAGDFDGDGDLDLATANTESQDVSILLNNGYGSFTLWKSLPVGIGVYAVTAADIDGDGDPDLVTTNGFTAEDGLRYTILRNVSNAAALRFALAPSGGVGVFAWIPSFGIAPADLNGDNQLDLAFAHSGSVASAAVLRNDLYPGAHSVQLTGLAAAEGIDFGVQVPGIRIDPTAGLTTTEAGGTSKFTVVLNTPPAADVTIGLSSSNPGEGTVSPANLTFTSVDWNDPRTVTITGVDDGVDDGDVSYLIEIAPATSDDPNYAGWDADDVIVVNLDNDAFASLDVDGSGTADALTDGVLVLRYLFGFTDEPLIEEALAQDATRTNPTDIAEFLDAVRQTILDADANGVADALTDGILILRYLFGFTGTTLTEGAIGPNAGRSDPQLIEAFLDGFNVNLDAGGASALSAAAAVSEDTAAPVASPDGIVERSRDNTLSPAAAGGNLAAAHDAVLAAAVEPASPQSRHAARLVWWPDDAHFWFHRHLGPRKPQHQQGTDALLSTYFAR